MKGRPARPGELPQILKNWKKYPNFVLRGYIEHKNSSFRFLKGFIMVIPVKISSGRRSDNSTASHGILPRKLPYKFDFYRKIYRISSVSIDFQQIFIVFLIKKLKNRWKLMEIDEIR